MRSVLAVLIATGLAACSAPEGDNVAESEPAETEEAEEETAGLPGTDIHLFALSWDDDQPVLGDRQGGVFRTGYDNQPFFLVDGSGFYYAADDESGETDVWFYDLVSQESRQITDTPGESEYSPRQTPDGNGISYIYQPPGGYAGNVYLANADNSERHAAEDLAPVGYYALTANLRHVAVFALGEPNTIQLIDRQAEPEAPIHIADNPGRSFFMTPRGHAIYFTIGDEDGRHEVQLLDPVNETISPLFGLPGVSQDFTVTLRPNDTVGFFAIDEGRLLYRTAGAWQPIADLGALGLSGMTRLAVSPDGQTLAVVANETPAD